MYSISSTTRTFVRLCSDERSTSWIMERPAGSLASCLKQAHTHTHTQLPSVRPLRDSLCECQQTQAKEMILKPCLHIHSTSFSITTHTHCHETPFFFHPITVLSVSLCPGTTQLYFGIIFKINYSESSNVFPVMVPPPQFSCFCLCISLFVAPSLFFYVFCTP